MVGRSALKLFAEIGPAASIVARIADYRGMRAHLFPAAAQMCQFADAQKGFGNCRAQMLGAFGQQADEFVHCVEQRVCVVNLAIACQCGRERAKVARGVLSQSIVQNFARDNLGRILRKRYRRAHLLCPCRKDGPRFGQGLANDDGNARLDNARLFAGHGCQGVAKELRMVKADIRNHAEQRRDDVCAIQPSAQANFNDGNIHLLLRKIMEGQRRS